MIILFIPVFTCTNTRGNSYRETIKFEIAVNYIGPLIAVFKFIEWWLYIDNVLIESINTILW